MWQEPPALLVTQSSERADTHALPTSRHKTQAIPDRATFQVRSWELQGRQQGVSWPSSCLLRERKLKHREFTKHMHASFEASLGLLFCHFSGSDAPFMMGAPLTLPQGKPPRWRASHHLALLNKPAADCVHAVVTSGDGICLPPAPRTPLPSLALTKAHL